jgi:hypothetical protein
MLDRKLYKKTILDLRHALFQATGLASLECPERIDAGSEMAKMGPHTFDNYRLKSIAEGIHQAIVEFDRLQRAAGLPAGTDGWFTRYLNGQCRDCGREMKKRKRAISAK